MLPTYLQLCRRLQVTVFGDLFQWVSGASAIDIQHTQIGVKCILNWHNFQPLRLYKRGKN